MAIPSIRSERLELVAMTADVLDALLDRRRRKAGPLPGIVVPEGWPDDHDRRFLRLRRDQMRREPARTEWLVRAITLRDETRSMIGHAGFHGPPGINGLRKATAVEVGYTIFEPHRGRGYATEATRALIEWAHTQHRIVDFIASIAPDNVPSLALVRRLGFVQTGRQWDEEDGEELVFELRLVQGTTAIEGS